jgi:O-antigen/teichoic acid export membrane protein
MSRPGKSMPTRTVERHILADLAKYFPSNLLPGAGYLVGVLVFTRAFSPGAYGWYVLAAAVASPAVGLLTQWMLRPAMRYYAEYQTHGGASTYTEALTTAVAFMCVAVLVLSAVAGVILWMSGWLQNHMVLGTGEFLFVLGSVPNAIALGVMRSSLKAGVFFRLAVVAEIMAIGFPLFMIFEVSHDIGWLAWGQALSVLVVLPYALRSTGITPRQIRFRFYAGHREVFGRFIRYGAPMVIWFVGANLLSVEARYVLQLFRGQRELGIYGANFDLMVAIATILNGTIVLGFGPALFHHWAQGRKAEVIRAISDATDLYLLLGIGFVGGVLVVGPSVEQVVVGPHFRLGAEFLVPAALAMVFFGMGLIGHKCLELGEGTAAMASSAIWAGIVNLVLNLLLVPSYGYMASVYVACVCYGLYSAFIWLQARALSVEHSRGGTLSFLVGRELLPGRFRSQTISIGGATNGKPPPAAVPWVIHLSGVGRALVAGVLAAAVGLLALAHAPDSTAVRLVIGASVYSVVWLIVATGFGGLRTLWRNPAAASLA